MTANEFLDDWEDDIAGPEWGPSMACRFAEAYHAAAKAAEAPGGQGWMQRLAQRIVDYPKREE